MFRFKSFLSKILYRGVVLLLLVFGETPAPLLRQALQDQDAAALAELAHKIIGGARIVGAGEVVQVQQAGKALMQQLEAFGKLLTATLKILD